MSRGAAIGGQRGVSLGVKALTEGGALAFTRPHQVGEIGF